MNSRNLLRSPLSMNSLLMLFLLFSGCDNKHPVAIISTELGEIEVEIYTDNAPITASNFLKLCEEDVYRNAMFYRVVNTDNQAHNKVKIDVIQGGLFIDSIIDTYPVIPHETTESTGIMHLDGTISMARNEPGTASTEFFICIGKQAELDFGGKRNPDGQGFAAFGRVINGMDIVHKIHAYPNKDQYIDDPIMISNIELKR